MRSRAKSAAARRDGEAPATSPAIVHVSAPDTCPLDLEAVANAVRAILDRHAPRTGEVEVVLVSGDEIAELNFRTRGEPEATDVISFPGPDFEGAPLGEIAVSIQHVALGAAARAVEPDEEAMFLAAHGALHLCGFDDETESGRDEMVRLANEALASLGVQEQPDWHSQPHPGAN